MFHQKRRGILASAGALITAAALALGGAAAANADPADGDAISSGMPTTSGVVITKLKQGEGTGKNADGTEQLSSQLPSQVPISDVHFAAYKVTLKDGSTDLVPGTNKWQAAVAGLTVSDLPDGSEAENPSRTGSTNEDGKIEWIGTGGNGALERGVYVVRETRTPPGVVPSGDFLLTVPLTDPKNLNKWLDTIYVYPKNRTLEGVKSVKNATDYAVGDTVTWTINIDNPSVRNQLTGAWGPTDKFEIYDTIEDEYLNAEEAGVKVSGLEEDVHYTVELVKGDVSKGVKVGFTQIKVVLTTEGLKKLSEAENPAVAKVTVTIDTKVMKAGVIENSAQFVSSGTQTKQKEVPPTEVRYGAAPLEKKSTSQGANLAGAEFRVYLTEAAAKAASAANEWGGRYSSPGNENGYLVPSDGPKHDGSPTGVFVTNTDGKVSIGGLRHSDYADGKLLTKGTDEAWQTYYLVETKALEGHQLLGEVVPFEIIGGADGTDQISTIEITNAKDGGFKLPLTGGMGTAIFTLLGAGILGAVLVVARRRSGHAAE